MRSSIFTSVPASQYALIICDPVASNALRAINVSVNACTGALIWHGRDLRRYKRLLSPPLQRLLTCPGTAALGRGLASMPASYAHEVLCSICGLNDPIRVTLELHM